MRETCLRCGAAMEWRHQTWQCPRCRFKIGCCEGDSCEALDSAEPGNRGRVSEERTIAGYEQLRRVAEQAGDGETADVAARLLDQDRAAEASLRPQGITA
jgi:hypothetical protein